MEKKKLNLETTLKKATIEMLLLNLLKEQDMYGYQLSQELKKRSSGLYTILEGSMYPILYRPHLQNNCGKTQAHPLFLLLIFHPEAVLTVLKILLFS